MEMEKQIQEILKGVQEIKIELATQSVHRDQHRKELNDLQQKVELHEKNQNKFFGFISLLGMGMTAFFSWLFKHI
jgi:hypothetical protein